mmetsp:Transcript_35801/g.75362  ORF Transcript_35801/g.75362 Transcript_35801/m.75362 type:complete len:94 (+) Transcript_35801:596-877(+)
MDQFSKRMGMPETMLVITMKPRVMGTVEINWDKQWTPSSVWNIREDHLWGFLISLDCDSSCVECVERKFVMPRGTHYSLSKSKMSTLLSCFQP